MAEEVVVAALDLVVVEVEDFVALLILLSLVFGVVVAAAA